MRCHDLSTAEDAEKAQRKDMNAFHLVEFGEAVAPRDLQQALYEHAEQPVMRGTLQYLRDEAMAALAESVKATNEGRPEAAAFALGGFDRLSQVVVKLDAMRLMMPEPEE